MPTIVFAPAIQRHVPAPPLRVAATSVRAALEAAFAATPKLRDYLLEDQGQLRKHIAIFIDGRLVADRQALTDEVSEYAEIYVVQALSGG